jgi:hypothetical protein
MSEPVLARAEARTLALDAELQSKSGTLLISCSCSCSTESLLQVVDDWLTKL